MLLVVGGVALILSLVYCLLLPGSGGASRFMYAYLTAFAFALAITLGNLFFIVGTSLFHAGWHTAFRRVPETFAANMPTLGILFIPIVIFMLLGGQPGLYPWANPAAHVYPNYGGHGESHGDDHGEAHADDHAAHDGPNPFLAGKPGYGEDGAPAAHDHAHGDGEHDHGHPAVDPPGHASGAGIADSDEGLDAGHESHTAMGAEDPGGEHDGPHDVDAGDPYIIDPLAGVTPGQYTHTGDTWPAHDHAVPYFTASKGIWYTKPFFILRWTIYFTVWSFIGIAYWKTSLKQDQTGDYRLTNRREWWAPISTILFGVTITGAAIDLLLSVDPVWYSTMFGVYFFAGAMISGLCTIILTLMIGQRFGYFPAIGTNHYHDLGKLLFAFTFFWGYVAFSQFMLIWYASLPETTYWFEIRGVTSVGGAPTYGGPWTVVALILLFGHLLGPFAFLLSKHVKRNRAALAAAAVWMLFMCYLDLYWVTMPAFSSPQLLLPIPEALAAVGTVCLALAGAVRLAAKHPLAAYNDPRMHESLGLDTAAWAPVHVH